MSMANPSDHKVVRLWQGEGSRATASPVTLQVRNRVALMQGYAGMLGEVSPELQQEVLRELSAKTKELVQLLVPFVNEQARHGTDIEAYREVRRRTRRLVNQYRANLRRAREQVEFANQSLARGAIGSGSRPLPNASERESVRL